MSDFCSRLAGYIPSHDKLCVLVYIREIHFGFMTQEAWVLPLRMVRTLSGRLSRRLSSDRTIRVVAPEAVDQGFDWVELASSLCQFRGE